MHISPNRLTGGHYQTNLNGPAKGAGLRRSGRQLIGFLTQGRFSLTMPMGGLNLDAYNFWAVSEGGEEFSSSMPAFKEVLSEQERWQILLYVANGFQHRDRQVAPREMPGVPLIWFRPDFRQFQLSTFL